MALQEFAFSTLKETDVLSSKELRSRLRVLVVDDDDAIRDLAGIVLSEEYEVETAGNAIDAACKIGQGGWSLVLLDYRMPGVTGGDLLRVVKSNLDEGQEMTPVVFMTAGGISRSEALQLGAVDYLAKPFDLDYLLKTVKNHCQVRPSPPIPKLVSNVSF